MFRKRGNKTKELWSDFESEALPYMADLYRLAVWLTENREEAEDLVQETMAAALKSFKRYEVGTNCRAWLTTIMYRLNWKYLSASRKLQTIDEPEEKLAANVPFEPSLPQHVTDDEVIAALQRLPEIFRQVVVLSDVEEFSYKEIALILEIPIGTVMSRLSRGRGILRLELADYARSCGLGADKQKAAG